MANYLTLDETSKKIGVSKETLRRWDRSGKFECVRHPVSKYRMYKEENVISFVNDYQLWNKYEFNKEEESNTKPYFGTDYGKLYQTDSLKYLRTMEDESVDLIFSDPPYNIKKAEWDTFSSQLDYVNWSMNWIKEAHRILTKTGSLYICGFSEILADLKWASSKLFSGCKWLIWFYRNKGNLGNDWGRSHESILHLRKSKKFIFNIDAVRIPYNEHTLKYPKRTQAISSQFSRGKENGYIWEPNPLGAKPKDVLEISRDVLEIPTISNSSWEKTLHETQKPIELLRKIILSSSNQDSVILDPFCGSGTSVAVAEAYKRRWIGIELEERYCNVIKDRINNKSLIERIYFAKEEMDSLERRIKLRG
ncbi:MAG: MerR family transcriptional regulator [Bacteroidota bacterium]|nr:MerR family transcriptional regulator [Bacteroidota bacterium]